MDIYHTYDGPDSDLGKHKRRTCKGYYGYVGDYLTFANKQLTNVFIGALFGVTGS